MIADLLRQDTKVPTDTASYRSTRTADEIKETANDSAHDESSVGLTPIDLDDTEELDRIYKKLDKRIISGLWILYFMASFSYCAYGNTLTMNREQGHSLIQKLKLSRKQLSTASALDYVGIIIFDAPLNLVMTRVSPHAWLSRIIFVTGLVYACYAALENAQGLQACRFISGVVGAGMWPGLSYYTSLWYPSNRSTRRIGYYFTASHVSAASSGLVAAGVQKLDGHRGFVGWQWLYLIYGSVTMVVGILLIWWLPDRPFKQISKPRGRFLRIWHKLTTTPHPLNAHERELHRRDLQQRYKKVEWEWRDILAICADIRFYPFLIMYFGSVGIGYGLAVFGTTIISKINPKLSSIQVSLLFAPIWICDLTGVLIMSPLVDRYPKYRSIIFICSFLVISAGLFIMTFSHGAWPRYAGLLITGYGLGPTVPICMAWNAEVFGRRHGDVGVALSAALMTGLGAFASVTVTYALYSGWPADEARLYRYSNMILFLFCCTSMVACVVCRVLEMRKK